MTDKLEEQLAEGIERAQSLHPLRSYAPLVQGATVEQKLQAIEKLVAEIRSMSAQVKGLLG